MNEFNAALVCCSDARCSNEREQIDLLCNSLEQIGIHSHKGEYLFAASEYRAFDPIKKASELMCFYDNTSIDMIFDISGGNLSNQILPYIDYKRISMSDKMFWGYSDLTALINAIYTKTQKPSVLYQIRNIIGADSAVQTQRVKEYFNGNNAALFDWSYEWINGTSMRGVAVGGNIRCFLKLAGTPYFPDMKNKILVLESYSGDALLMSSFLAQLEQLGVFQQINGILLGTFTHLDSMSSQPDMTQLVMQATKGTLPLAKTYEIGHHSDAKAIVIGEELILY